jgi:hypothetical protein
MINMPSSKELAPALLIDNTSSHPPRSLEHIKQVDSALLPDVLICPLILSLECYRIAKNDSVNVVNPAAFKYATITYGGNYGH